MGVGAHRVCGQAIGSTQTSKTPIVSPREASMIQTRRLFLAAMLLLAGGATVHAQAPVTVYEGARLITGEGNVIENAAFVVGGTRFIAACRSDGVFVPHTAARVDLAG